MLRFASLERPRSCVFGRLAVDFAQVAGWGKNYVIAPCAPSASLGSWPFSWCAGLARVRADPGALAAERGVPLSVGWWLLQPSAVDAR